MKAFVQNNFQNIEVSSGTQIIVCCEAYAIDTAADERFQWLDESERTRSRHIRVGSDKRRFMTSRVALRLALSNMSEGRIAPYQWHFSTDVHGKPVIGQRPDLPSWQFSISHAYKVTAIATSKNRLLGIDITRITPAADAISIDHAMTSLELTRLNAMTPNQRWRESVRLWTIKEAWSKLIGQGVHMDFAAIEADSLGCGTPPGESIPFAKALLETRVLNLEDVEYQLALAVGKPTRDENDIEYSVTDSIGRAVDL